MHSFCPSCKHYPKSPGGHVLPLHWESSTEQPPQTPGERRKQDFSTADKERVQIHSAPKGDITQPQKCSGWKKTSKVIKPSTTQSTAGPCPQVPHLHSFWTLPEARCAVMLMQTGLLIIHHWMKLAAQSPLHPGLGHVNNTKSELRCLFFSLKYEKKQRHQWTEEFFLSISQNERRESPSGRQNINLSFILARLEWVDFPQRYKSSMGHVQKKTPVQPVAFLPGDKPGDTNGGLPGMTQPRAQRPASLLLWNCQGRKQTWCSECQREGSAAEWTWPASCWKDKREPGGEREGGKRLRNPAAEPWNKPWKFIISPCPTDCRWLVISDLVVP